MPQRRRGNGRKSRESKGRGISFLSFTFSFAIIVDSQTVIRDHTEAFHMLLSVFPNGNTLPNYSILFFFFFDRRLRISSKFLKAFKIAYQII